MKAVKQRDKGSMNEMARNGRGNLRQGNTKETEKSDLQNGGETSAYVWGGMLDNEKERRGFDEKNRDVDVTMDSGCFKEGKDKEHRDQKKMWSRGHCGKGERSKLRWFGHVARRDEG